MFDDAQIQLTDTHTPVADDADVVAVDNDASPRVGRVRRRIGALSTVLLLGAYGASALLASNEVVVKPGDTLTRIAGDYQVPVKELVAYNGIEDPNVIVAGRTIVIPPKSGELQHEVRDGDTLSGIAAIYGVSPASIVTRNNLKDADYIRIGQALVIPRKASAVAAPVVTIAPPTTAASPAAAPVTTAPPTTVAPAAPAVTAAPSAANAAPATSAAPPTTAAAAPAPTAPTAPPSTATPPTIPKVTVPKGGIVSTMWVVQPGDTIASIAARFGLSTRRLASANALGENDPLIPGQRIYVPQG